MTHDDGFLPGLFIGVVSMVLAVAVLMVGNNMGRTGMLDDVRAYGCEKVLQHYEAKP